MTLLDQAVLAQLAEDIGEEMMPVVIGVFIEEVGEQLAQLPPLYEQEEWRALGRLAHSLKSSCASYGARLSQQQVVALELACQRQDSAERPAHRPVAAVFAPGIHPVEPLLPAIILNPWRRGQ